MPISVISTGYSTDIKRFDTLSDVPRRLSFLLGRFTAKSADAMRTATALQQPALRMLEHHLISAVKGTDRVTIMFATPDAVQAIAAAKVLTIEVKDSFKIVISPQEPNQQVLSTCLVLDSLPSAEALTDNSTMRNEVLKIMSTERGATPLASCKTERRSILSRTPETGSMATFEQLTTAADTMSNSLLVAALQSKGSRTQMWQSCLAWQAAKCLLDFKCCLTSCLSAHQSTHLVGPISVTSLQIALQAAWAYIHSKPIDRCSKHVHKARERTMGCCLQLLACNPRNIQRQAEQMVDLMEEDGGSDGGHLCLP